MEEYRVDFDFEKGEPERYSAAVNMALDEHILEKAAEEDRPYLRIYGFEDPAFIPSRRTSVEDIAAARENGYDFTRRDTNGSTIPCLENGLAYSVAYPTDDFPDRVFQERVAPALLQALESVGVDGEYLNVCVKHDAIRYGERQTPGDAAAGRTIVGNSLWRNGGSVLSHGVIAVEPWDADFLGENLDLRPGEGSFVDDLPSVTGEDGNVEDVPQAILDGFTGGHYEPASLDSENIEELLNGKYLNREWVLEKGSEPGRGHCFVEEGGEGFY